MDTLVKIHEFFSTSKCISNLVSTFTYIGTKFPYICEGGRHFQLAYHQHCLHSLPDVLFDYFPIPIFHFPAHCNSSFGNYFWSKWCTVNTQRKEVYNYVSFQRILTSTYLGHVSNTVRRANLHYKLRGCKVRQVTTPQ